MKRTNKRLRAAPLTSWRKVSAVLVAGAVTATILLSGSPASATNNELKANGVPIL